jgi:hypothetical protein
MNVPVPSILREVRLDSARELVDHLIHEYADGRDYIYRGQSIADWLLQPSAWRPGSQTQKLADVLASTPEVIDNPALWGLVQGETIEQRIARIVPSNDCEKRQRVKPLMARLIAENFIINRFVEGCDLAGLHVPGVSHPQASFEVVFDAFFNVPRLNFANSWALAQHVGVPTRLLDFSENPMKALFFATYGSGKHLRENLADPAPSKDKCFAVWVLGQPVETDVPALLDRPTRLFKVLRSTVPFLHAQDGLFLCSLSASNRYFIDNGQWPSIEAMLPGWSISKVTAPLRLAQEVLKKLKALGIDQPRLMPSYESVAKGITDK